MKPVVAIIGAGPAGLTAALELVRDGRMLPIVSRSIDEVGGISRTVEYKGNRMDIGGHRFFSKSDWVMNWWREILPIAADEESVEIAYQGQRRESCHRRRPAGCAHGLTMLVRQRLSRIYFLRKYFDYPIKLNGTTLANLGPVRLLRIGFSYLMGHAVPASERPLAGGLPGQSLRRRVVPHLLHGLHREGLGRAVQPDQRRMGRPAHQGAIGDRSHQACLAEGQDRQRSRRPIPA
jgi:hypothetical protein